MTNSSKGSERTVQPPNFIFLTDIAAQIELPFDYQQFPTDEDTTAWIEINSQLFRVLHAARPVQAVELVRLWREAQVLLLGLLCRRTDAVPFLQNIDLLVHASRRLCAQKDSGISGDIFSIPASASEEELLKDLHRLQDQISDYRRQQLMHLAPSIRGRHPDRAISEHQEHNMGNRTSPLSSVTSAASSPQKRSSTNLEIAFQELMSEAVEVKLHFNGDYLQLEKASLCLKHTFQRFADHLSTPELSRCWNDWLYAQAWLFWRYKSAPANQSPEAARDDLMQAKRYLGYLVADDLLARILRSDGCVKNLLSPERINYLVSLPVEEFLRTKAYFFYLARSRRTTDLHSPAYEREDRAFAEGFVYDTLLMLFDLESNRHCVGCTSAFSELFRSILPSKDIVRSIPSIVGAKRRDAIRLDPHNTSNLIGEQDIAPLYDWLNNGRVDPAPPESVQELLRHFNAMNMFELLMICPIVRRSHNNSQALLPDGARLRSIAVLHGRVTLAGAS